MNRHNLNQLNLHLSSRESFSRQSPKRRLISTGEWRLIMIFITNVSQNQSLLTSRGGDLCLPASVFADSWLGFETFGLLPKSFLSERISIRKARTAAPIISLWSCWARISPKTAIILPILLTIIPNFLWAGFEDIPLISVRTPPTCCNMSSTKNNEPTFRR